MSGTAVETTPSAGPASSNERVEALVRRWLPRRRLAGRRRPPSWPGLLRDPQGLAFAVGFVDGVIRPEDVRAAAARWPNWRRTCRASSPPPCAPRSASAASWRPCCPASSCRSPAACCAAWSATSSSTPRRPPRRAIARHPAPRRAAQRQPARRGGARRERGRPPAARDARLLGRPDVDYVSVKVSATVAPHSAVGLRRGGRRHRRAAHPAVTLAARRPRRQVHQPRHGGVQGPRPHDRGLHRAARPARVPRPRGRHRAAGLPAGRARRDDAPAGVGGRRRARGGAAIKVRLVKGANLPMEQVEASLHGWPLATWDEQAGDRHQLQARARLRAAPERIDNVRLGVAGHNLFDIAYAWLLAGRRGVRDGVEFEMLLGMADGPGRGGPARRRRAAAVHPGRAPGASSTSPSPTSCAAWKRAPAARTSCPRCSSSRDERALFAASASASSLPWPTLDDPVPQPNRAPGPRAVRGTGAARHVREHRRHRPVAAGEPGVGRELLAACRGIRAGRAARRGRTPSTDGQLDVGARRARAAGSPWGAGLAPRPRRDPASRRRRARGRTGRR